MRPAIRQIILISSLVVTAAGLVLLVTAKDRHRSKLTCEGLKVEYADANRFVSEDDVRAYIEKYYGSYIGQRLDSVNLCRIEKILDEQSAVLKSEAFITPDGNLNIRLAQRAPVLRFQKGDTGFYVDERGYIFPLQENYSADVPVVDGNIPIACEAGYKGKARTEAEDRWINGVLGMMAWLSRSKTWKDSIVQVAVSSKGDLILVPRVGKEKIVFGSPDGVADKFSRIEKYYEYIRPSVEEGYYSTVNVKYDGQIICRK